MTHNLSLATMHKGALVSDDLVTNFQTLSSVFGRAGPAHNHNSLCDSDCGRGELQRADSGLTEPPYTVKRVAAFAAIACGCQGAYSTATWIVQTAGSIPTNSTVERRLHELSQLGTEMASLEPFLLADPSPSLSLQASLPGHFTLGTLRRVDGLGSRAILVNGYDRSQLVNVSLGDVLWRSVWMEPWDVQVLPVEGGETEPFEQRSALVQLRTCIFISALLVPA